jgi:protein-tyrosine phosphatase
VGKYLRPSLEFIDQAIQGGGCVLVHCKAGVSRSATVVIGEGICFYLLSENVGGNFGRRSGVFHSLFFLL